MDAAAFAQVYQDFQEFHAYFAGLFGRRETRLRSGHYLQALLVQSEERRKRRESVGDGSRVGPGDAAVSHRLSLGR